MDEMDVVDCLNFRAGDLLDALALARSADIVFFHLSSDGERVFFRDLSYDHASYLKIVFEDQPTEPMEYTCMGVMMVDDGFSKLRRLVRDGGLMRSDMLVYELGQPDGDGFSWARVRKDGEDIYVQSGRFSQSYSADSYYDMIRYAQRLPEPVYQYYTDFKIGVSRLLHALDGDLIVFEGGEDGVYAVGYNYMCRHEEGGEVEFSELRRVSLDVRTDVRFGGFAYHRQRLHRLLNAIKRLDETAVATVSFTSKMTLIVETRMAVGEVRYVLAPMVFKSFKPSYDGVPIQLAGMSDA